MSSDSNAKLNSLRAAVLGANDGVVSVASIIFGVAGASNSTSFIFTAGLAGLVAGALSMAVGEYVSVSTQRDAEVVLGVKDHHLVNPWQAAFASGAAFFTGAIIPLVAVVLPTGHLRLFVTFVAVLAVLIITGTLSAHAGGANKVNAIVRVVLGGVIAMTITYAIGKAFGTVGI